MKLDAAIRMAAVCGLSTYGEAVMNVEVHATSLFSYADINEEIKELTRDIQQFKELHGKNWMDEKIPQEIIEEEDRKMNEYFDSLKN